MIDLTQQRMAEYEAYLNELLEKLKVPDPIYSQEQRFQNATVITMSSMVNAEEFGVDYGLLKPRLIEFTEQYRRKL